MYRWEGMIKISKEDAIARMRAGTDVYLLYPDDSEALVEDIEDLYAHDGEFGYEKRKEEV